MTPVFPARRRAEEFHAQVEGTSTGSDARHAEFLEIVAALRDVPQATPRADFAVALRERLMTAAQTELAPAARDAAEARLVLPGRRPSRERRLAAAVGGLALVGATTSMAVAAQSALPGDALYPLKRAIENVHAGISVGEADKGATILDSASGRLDEATALSRSGRLEDSPAIADTLNAFTEQSTEASDLLLADYANTGDQASIEELHAFTATSMSQLTDLEALVPIDARDELLHAAQVLAQIDSQVQRACPGCTPSISEVPNILVSAGYAATGIDLPLGELLGAEGIDTQGAVKDGDGRRGTKDGKGGGDAGTTPVLPGADDLLGDGGVLDPDGSTGDGGSGSGSGNLQDTVDELTDTLLGSNDDSTTSGGSGDDGVLGDLGDTVDDVTGGLLNP